MKKLLVILLMTTMLVLPNAVNASETTKEPINIYVFHGDGCTYCAKAFQFFKSIEKEYGSYFNLVRFETWKKPANDELMNKVAAALKEEADGVPYIIIGEKTFKGFTQSWAQDIKDAIKAEYDKEKRSTVAKDVIGNATPDSVEEIVDNSTAQTVTLIIFGVLTAGIILLVFLARKKSSK